MKNTITTKKNTITALTRRRNFTVVPELIKKDMFVYNGKKSIYIQPAKSHLGHKLGMFAPTKKLGKEIHDSERNRKRKNKKKNKK
jgi:ribosomal protein S19